MEDYDEDVLDQLKELPEQQWYEHWSLVYIPLFLIIVGVLFNLQNWPFAGLLIAIGLLLAMIRSFIYFLAKKRPLHEWVYFLARITLFSVLFINFGIVTLSSTTFVMILCIYAFGVILHLMKSKPVPRGEEKPEDDY